MELPPSHPTFAGSPTSMELELELGYSASNVKPHKQRQTSVLLSQKNRCKAVLSFVMSPRQAVKAGTKA